jgi:hypothetical protein
MPDHAVTAIEMLRAQPVDLAHRLWQIGLDRFEHQVVMITHLAVTVHD